MSFRPEVRGQRRYRRGLWRGLLLVFLPVFVLAAVAFLATHGRSAQWTIGGPRPRSVSDAEIQTASVLVGALSGFICAATVGLLSISKVIEIRHRMRSRAASRKAGTQPQALKAIGRSGDDRCPTCHGTGTVSGPDLGPYRQRVACIACMGTGWLHLSAANVHDETTRIQVDEVTTVIAPSADEVTTAIKARAVAPEDVTRPTPADEATRRLTGA
jgi:hypothetical protein